MATLRALCIGAIAVLALAMTTDTAMASDRPAGVSQGQHVRLAEVIRVPMRLDCTHLSKRARTYADAHNYCTESNGAVSPNDVQYGNCGDDFIWVWDDASDGHADIQYGFDSSKGTVIYRSLAIGYAGDRSSGAFHDTGTMASSSLNHVHLRVYFGVGEATAGLGGSVTLWWGASCELMYASDTTYATVG